MDIAHQFRATSVELVAIQRELSQLYHLSADPILETQTSARRAELSARRDSLLDQWARLGLVWLLQGGGVQLLEPATPADGAREEGEGGEAPAEGAEPTGTVVTAPPAPAGSGMDYAGIDRGLATSWARPALAPRPAPVDLDRLREVLRAFDAPPTNITEESQVRDELRRLAENTTPAAIQVWTEFPKEIQRALIGMSVARARYVQDEISPALHPITIDQELDRFFSGMTAFSKREQPGFVFGLRRHHHPVAERWVEDAQRWWTELAERLPEPITPNPERALGALIESIDAGGGEEEVVQRALEVLDAGISPDDPRFVRLMIAHQDKLRRHTRFKRLRKALRDMVTEDEALAAASLAEAAELPEGWAQAGTLRGRHAVLVGGDLNEDLRQRLQDAFGFAGLEWITTEQARNVDELVGSIRDGGVNFVIVLRRFVGPDLERRVMNAARTARAPAIAVEGAYGVQTVRQAIEAALVTPRDADDAS